MKNIVKFASVIALGLALASCSKEAPGKSEVEAGFETFKGSLPTLTLAANPTVDAVAGTAEVELTISGLDTTLDSLSVGVLSSTDPTFATSTITLVENPTDGKVKVLATVAPNKTYYLKATASCLQENSYSETLEVKVPDVPFCYKVPGTYAGTTESLAYGDAYDKHVITILKHETDVQKCYVCDLDPYWYGQGALTAKYNWFWVEANIDNEQQTITIPNGSDFHCTGFKEGFEYAVLGVDESGASGVDLVFKFDPATSVLTMLNSFYTYKIDVSGAEEDASAAEDWYGKGVYKKQ